MGGNGEERRKKATKHTLHTLRQREGRELTRERRGRKGGSKKRLRPDWKRSRSGRGMYGFLGRQNPRDQCMQQQMKKGGAKSAGPSLAGCLKEIE